MNPDDSISCTKLGSTNALRKGRAMAKKIRAAGYVTLVGGVLMILATYAGVVVLDGFDVLEVNLKLSNVRNYVALVPG